LAGENVGVALMPQTAARFRRETTLDGVRLVVEGDLDYANSDLFASLLETLMSEAPALEVDLGDVSFFGSDAMGALILACAHASEADVKISLVTSPTVDKMLEMSGLTRVLAST
jgi:anti-anti-sigma factor